MVGSILVGLGRYIHTTVLRLLLPLLFCLLFSGAVKLCAPQAYYSKLAVFYAPKLLCVTGNEPNDEIFPNHR